MYNNFEKLLLFHTKMHELLEKNHKPVFLFCLFYSRIQAASQSIRGLYFPIFDTVFFPNLRIYFKIWKAQAVSQRWQ